jgi:hypothetical protein
LDETVYNGQVKNDMNCDLYLTVLLTIKLWHIYTHTYL